MAYLNVKMPAAQNSFNWDDIEVGNHALDHSQDFFARKHIKHERLDEVPEEMELNKQFESSSINENASVETASDRFPNNNKENTPTVANTHGPSIKQEASTADSPTDVKGPPLLELQASNAPAPTSAPTSAPEQGADETMLPSARAPPNLASQWSTQKRVVSAATAVSSKGAIAKPSGPPPPHVYEFKDVYQRRKEEALRKKVEEERKMREFHSRPMPDYSAQQKQLERRKVTHAVTVPVTPMVLKNSIAAEERRKKKMSSMNVGKKEEEQKRQLQPVTTMTTATGPRPFNLQCEKRAQERRQYDIAVQIAMEQKQKQEEKERRKREEKRVKELRKMTAFKARPNPFK